MRDGCITFKEKKSGNNISHFLLEMMQSDQNKLLERIIK